MKAVCHLVVFAAAVLGLGNPVFAQEAKTAAPARTHADDAAIARALENAMVPGEGQKKLEAMIGTFNVKIRTWVNPSQPPVESQATSVSTWVLGNRYVQTMLSGYVMNEPFNGIGYIAYDNVRKTYQLAWMDSDSTAMTLYQGGFDAASKNAKLTGTTADPLTGQPSPLEMRMSLLDNGDHVSELWGQGSGKTLFKMMELRYSRTQK